MIFLSVHIRGHDIAIWKFARENLHACRTSRELRPSNAVSSVVQSECTTKIKEVIIINHLYYSYIMDVKRMLAVMARKKKA